MNYWCLCLSVCERERLWVFLLLERIMSGLAFQQSKTCKTSHKQIYSFNQTAWLDNSPGNNSGQQLTIWSYNLQLITVFLSDSFGGGFFKKKKRERESSRDVNAAWPHFPLLSCLFLLLMLLELTECQFGGWIWS